jgi:hypothetical protein
VLKFDDVLFENQGICDKVFPQLLRLESGQKFARKQKTHYFRAILVRLAVMQRDPATFNHLMVVIN